MGKRRRLIKEKKLEQQRQVKLEALSRKKARMASALALTKKAVITIAITLVVLSLGVFINQHMNNIFVRLLNRK